MLVHLVSSNTNLQKSDTFSTLIIFSAGNQESELFPTQSLEIMFIVSSLPDCHCVEREPGSADVPALHVGILGPDVGVRHQRVGSVRVKGLQ
jgi:hypothetical protein